MKILVIRNKLDKDKKDLAYIFYYEKEKRFYITINDDADIEKLPFILDTFYQVGEKTINAYWSEVLIKQRIVPSNRQNIAQILKDNNLKEYDEYALLVKSKGICSHDNCYVEEIKESDLPKSIINLNNQKVEEVLTLEDNYLLVFFRDGKVNKCDLNSLVKDDNKFNKVLKDKNEFNKAYVETGGEGVCFNLDLCISASTLYKNGQSIPLSINDFKSFVLNRIVDSEEAASILRCSRQNIDDLTKKNRLHPIKTSNKYRLYLKNEIEKRRWK